nr:HD domain-containing protein [Pantoea sp. Mhis]
MDTYKYYVTENVCSSDLKLEQFFCKAIIFLVHAVQKTINICHLTIIYNNHITSEEFDNMWHLLLGMIEDLRCIVIKLTERITYLGSMEKTSENKKILANKATINIHAILANRLDIRTLKWQLEDYCFRYLYPDEYRKIANLLHERRIDREHYVKQFVKNLRREMHKEGVYAKVYGRPKHIYSIWRKMKRKSLNFNEIFDLSAVRIVANRIQDCYGALSTVHTLYYHLPSEFDDYIANPKLNGYQSIHTVILGPYGKIIEVQIRTYHMHENAELGVAAHWKYKENLILRNTRAIGYEFNINCLSNLFIWQQNKFIYNDVFNRINIQIFKNLIHVLNVKLKIVRFLSNLTFVNLIYYTYSYIEHRYIDSIINGYIVRFGSLSKIDKLIKFTTQKKINFIVECINTNLYYIDSNRESLKIKIWFCMHAFDIFILIKYFIFDKRLNNLTIAINKAEKMLILTYKINSQNMLLTMNSRCSVPNNQIVNFLLLEFSKLHSESKEHTILLQLVLNLHLFIMLKRKESLLYYILNSSSYQPIANNDSVNFTVHSHEIYSHHVIQIITKKHTILVKDIIIHPLLNG